MRAMHHSQSADLNAFRAYETKEHNAQSHCLSQSLSVSPEGPRHWFGVPEFAECTQTGACLACNQKCEMEPFELKGQERRK